MNRRYANSVVAKQEAKVYRREGGEKDKWLARRVEALCDILEAVEGHYYVTPKQKGWSPSDWRVHREYWAENNSVWLVTVVTGAMIFSCEWPLLPTGAMQCVSWLISAFPCRCGWAWISFATQHKCASKSAITWRLSFSGYLTARYHPLPLPCHSAHLQERKMVWEASIMVAGWVGEGCAGPANSTISRMTAVELFGLVFIQSYLWYIGPYSFSIDCDTVHDSWRHGCRKMKKAMSSQDIKISVKNKFK